MSGEITLPRRDVPGQGARRYGLRSRLTLAFALSSGIPLLIFLAMAFPFAGRLWEQGIKQEIDRAEKEADDRVQNLPKEVADSVAKLVRDERVLPLLDDPPRLLRLVKSEHPHESFGLDAIFFVGPDGRYLVNSLEYGNTGLATPEERSDFEHALDGKSIVRWVREEQDGTPTVYVLAAQDVGGVSIVGARALGVPFLDALWEAHKSFSFLIAPSQVAPFHHVLRPSADKDDDPLKANGEPELERRYFRRVIPLATLSGRDAVDAAGIAKGGGGRRVALILLRSKADLKTRELELFGIFAALLGLALGLSWVTGYVLSRRITDPVARLVDALAQVAGGNLDVRVNVPEGASEIAHMGEAFNRMATDLQENKQKLLRAERIAAWQEIARRLAHEIKNPLSPIRLAIENCRTAYDRKMPEFDEIFREASQAVLEEVEKLRRIVEEFSQFARLPKPVLTRQDLNEVVRGALKLYGSVAPRVTLSEDLDPSLPPFLFDQDQIHRVLVNLVQNAIDVSPSGAEVRILTRRAGDPGKALLSVADRGPGIHPEIKERLFTPYFTTKAQGTGLGLAISARIVEEHGGTIQAIPGSPGTTFVVSLPIRVEEGRGAPS